MAGGSSKKQLLSVSSQKYGERYSDHFFEQYKLYQEAIEKISDRRQLANTYFIGLHTILFAILGYSISGGEKALQGWFVIGVALAGQMICDIFWYLIHAYKQLNTGKFEVLHEMEEHLPMAPYAYEWQILGKGEEKEKYYPFSHIELLVPQVMAGLYLGIILFQCARLIGGPA
jgi:hypothetical protein